MTTRRDFRRWSRRRWSRGLDYVTLACGLFLAVAGFSAADWILGGLGGLIVALSLYLLRG